MKVNVWVAVAIGVGAFALGYFVDYMMNKSQSSSLTVTTPPPAK